MIYIIIYCTDAYAIASLVEPQECFILNTASAAYGNCIARLATMLNALKNIVLHDELLEKLFIIIPRGS